MLFFLLLLFISFCVRVQYFGRVIFSKSILSSCVIAFVSMHAYTIYGMVDAIGLAQNSNKILVASLSVISSTKLF